jgi:hypothetical protein
MTAYRNHILSTKSDAATDRFITEAKVISAHLGSHPECSPLARFNIIQFCCLKKEMAKNIRKEVCSHLSL